MGLVKLDTNGEAFRHLCECLHVLSLPFAARRPYLDRLDAIGKQGRADMIRHTLTTKSRQELEEQYRLSIEPTNGSG